MGALALLVAPPATAHVTATPPFLPTGSSTVFTFAAPNERGVRMTGFQLVVPSGFRVVEALGSAGWQAASSRTTATWAGGSLAPAAQAMFAVELAVEGAPRAATLRTEQLYPDGERVRWPVPITVLPADEASQQLGRALVAGVLALLLLTAGAALLWRHLGGSLQDR